MVQTVLDSLQPLLIVGAGHLVGPEGLIELLRADGYKVVQE